MATNLEKLSAETLPICIYFLVLEDLVKFFSVTNVKLMKKTKYSNQCELEIFRVHALDS